jgi:Helix-turn-helix domain
MADVIPFTPRRTDRSGLLRAARDRSGLTHTQFAALLGRSIGRPELSPGTIRAWESGAIPPPIEVLEAAQRLTPQAPPASPAAALDGTNEPAAHLFLTPPPAAFTGPATIETVMQAFRDADRQVGGGYVYGAVVRYLEHEIGPQLFGGTSDVFCAAAALTEMAGWMAHDAGDDALAGAHFSAHCALRQRPRTPSWRRTSTPATAISRNTSTALGTRFASPRPAEASLGVALTIQRSLPGCTRWRLAHSPRCDGAQTADAPS